MFLVRLVDATRKPHKLLARTEKDSPTQHTLLAAAGKKQAECEVLANLQPHYTFARIVSQLSCTKANKESIWSTTVLFLLVRSGQLPNTLSLSSPSTVRLHHGGKTRERCHRI